MATWNLAPTTKDCRLLQSSQKVGCVALPYRRRCHLPSAKAAGKHLSLAPIMLYCSGVRVTLCQLTVSTTPQIVQVATNLVKVPSTLSSLINSQQVTCWPQLTPTPSHPLSHTPTATQLINRPHADTGHTTISAQHTQQQIAPGHTLWPLPATCCLPPSTDGCLQAAVAAGTAPAATIIMQLAASVSL
jgi:hypothetical protein